VPDKAVISHRGEKYEIGRGKRFYGIWVIGAPYDAPVDRWPENSDGWEQAWRRFVSIEKPGTIAAVQASRSGLRLPFNRAADAPAPGNPGATAPPGLVPDDDDDLISFGGDEDDVAATPGAGPNSAGSDSAGSGSAGPNSAGPNSAGSGSAGSDSAGSDSAGPNSAGSGSAGSGSAEGVSSWTDSAETDSARTDGIAASVTAAALPAPELPVTPGAPAAGGTSRGASAPAGPAPVGAPRAGLVPFGEGRRPGTALLAAEGLLVVGVVLGLGGLFPAYVGGQSLLSQTDLVVPHLCYVVGWAVSAALIALGFARYGTARLGALLGLGLSAVTFGLFVADFGEVIQGSASLGTGLVVSLLGWLACTAGSALTLAVVGGGDAADSTPAGSASTGTATGFGQPAYGQQGYFPGYAQPGSAHPGHAQPGYAQPGHSFPGYGQPGHGQAGYGEPGYGEPGYGQSGYGQSGYGQPGYAQRPYQAQPGYGMAGFGSRAGRRIAGRSWLAWPSRAEAGPLGLLLLAAVGTVAAFAPSWDSYTLTTASGTSQTLTAGNAFANPGWVIFGNVAVMVAVVLVAALAAMWRPPRQGALLLAGAIVPLAAQAVSALIQVSQPASASMFGISQAQASAIGLTITSGVTSIFWVYCVFVISLLVSCAWLLTTPARPAMPPIPGVPWSPVPRGDGAAASAGGPDTRDGTDNEGRAEGGGQSAYA
jgi:hypothetical protein